MKSQCCNADVEVEVEVDKGGIRLFALTTGSFVCCSCREYCTRSKIKFEKLEKLYPLLNL